MNTGTGWCGVLVFTLLALGCFPALSQSSNVELTSLPLLVARPGEFVTVVFTLTQRGTASETFDLNLTLPQGFALVVSLDPLTVAPDVEQLLFLTVLVPQSAAAGDVTLTLTATSQRDPANAGSSQATVRVLQTAKLGVQLLDSSTPSDGQLQVRFVVLNRGNVADKVELSVVAQSGVSAQLSPRTLALDPGAQATVVVTLSTPPTIGTQSRQERVTLTATSTAFPDTSAVATTVIDLLPPLPQQVDTNLAWIMPAQETISLSEPRDPSRFLALSNFTGGGSVNGMRLGVRLAFDNALNVPALVLDLDTASIRTRLGDVSAAFDDFSGVSGRGALLTLRSPTVASQSQLTFVGVPAKTSTVGVNSGISVLDTDLSVSAVARLGLSQPQTILSVALHGRFFGALVASAQAALSRAVGTWDNASKANLTYTTGPLDLTFNFKRIGPAFLGSPKDQEKVTFRQTISLDALALQASVGFSRDNVNAVPTQPSVGSTTASLVTRAFFGANLPTLSLALDYGSNKSLSAPTLVDRQRINGSLRFTQPLSFASVALSFELERTLDQEANTDEGVLTLDGLLGWSANGFSRTLALSNVLALDFAAGLILNQRLTISTTASLPTLVGLLSLRLSNQWPQTTAFALLSSNVAQANLAVSGKLTFTKSRVTDFRIDLSVSKRFGITLPFFPVKGQIEGVAFVDANANGQPDVGEGVGQLILVGGGTRALSDERGFFRLPPLDPGNYLVNFERLTPHLVGLPTLPRAVTLRAGQRVRLALPLKRVAIVDGLVFNDRNKNGLSDDGEEGIGNVRATLRPDNGDAQQTRSTSNGRFSFVDLSPGRYTLSLDEATFPTRFVLTTAPQISVTVEPQATVNASFGLVEKPPEIRITFSLPFSDFSFEPSQPKVGQAVQFDASDSGDPDGEIVKFEWDFDGDGVSDAQGQIVTFSFTKTGPTPVSLTVTDNDGNADTTTQTVLIQAP